MLSLVFVLEVGVCFIHLIDIILKGLKTEFATYFDNFQLVAYGIQKGDQLESETAVDQKQNGIAVVVLEEITLNALMFNNLLFVLCVRK